MYSHLSSQENIEKVDLKEQQESFWNSGNQANQISPSNDETLVLPVFESWDEILKSLRVVHGKKNALRRVSPLSSPSLFASVQIVKRFWTWNLSLMLMICIAHVCLHILGHYVHHRVSFSHYTNGNEKRIFLNDTTIIKSILSYYNNLVLLKADIDLSFVMNKVVDASFWMVMKFLIATMILLIIRIIQRLSWCTTEFGTYQNAKNNPTYQDKILLDKAWKQAFRTCGWQDPSTNNHNAAPMQILYQPRAGFCGLASFNSALRTFPCNCVEKSSKDELIDPFIQLHSLPRYVTLEEGQQFFQEVIEKGLWSNTHYIPSSPSASIISSVEVVGGGKKGFASYYAFKEALKQMNHPTQPARILSIYGRSPLFFCDESGIKGMLKKAAMFGAAHWSPIVSYLEEEDLLLVMDVNDTYGKRGYLIPSRRMYDAVNTRCIVTGNYRGLLMLRGLPVNNKDDQTGQVNLPSPLLTKPYELSCAFGRLKEAYYKHIATSDVKKYTIDEIMNMNNVDEKSIRMVTFEPDDENNGSAIVSLHPVTFTNSFFLPRNENNEIDDNKVKASNIQAMLKVFEKMRIPFLVPVRGISNKISFNKIHSQLRSAGLIQFTHGTEYMYINLFPSHSTNHEDFCHRVQEQLKSKHQHKYEIHELNTKSKSKKDVSLIKKWGNVVANSYGFSSNVVRYNQTPGHFLGTAYQDVVHGTNLHQYVLCMKKDDSYDDDDCTVVACSTLYYNEQIQPNVACMFNVCVLKEYRGLGLGKIMSKYVIMQAQSRNIQQIILQATEKGKPVYEKLGFINSFDDLDGCFGKLSITTNDWKWKLFFSFIEIYYRFKH